MPAYNKELLAKAGVEPPKTFEELIEASKKLKAAGITPMIVAGKDRWPLSIIFMNVLHIVTGTLLFIVIARATFLSRSISRPIKNIVHEMRRVERGDLSPKMTAVTSYDELNYLTNHFQSMIGAVLRPL